MAWYVMRHGKAHGPFDSAQVNALAAQGQITADTQISQSQSGPWVAARETKGLFSSTAATSVAPPPTKAGEKCCPFCGETILAVAIKCKHCHEMLGAATTHHQGFTSTTVQISGNGRPASAPHDVQYPEIKRTCKKCGSVWFSDSQKEEMLDLGIKAQAMGNLFGMAAVGLNGYGRAGGALSVDDRQRSLSKEETDREKLEALRRCSKCNSTSFEEIRPPNPKAATSAKNPNRIVVFMVSAFLLLGALSLTIDHLFGVRDPRVVQRPSNQALDKAAVVIKETKDGPITDRVTDVIEEKGNTHVDTVHEVITIDPKFLKAVKVGKSLTDLIGGLTSVLKSVTDEGTAKAALPKLEEFAPVLEQLTVEAGKLPTEEKTAFGEFVGKNLGLLQKVIDTVTTIPGVKDVLGAVVAPMVEALTKLTK